MMEKLLLLYIVINCVVVGLCADLPQCFRLKMGEVSCTESVGMKTIIKTVPSSAGNCLTKEDGKKIIDLVEAQSKIIQPIVDEHTKRAKELDEKKKKEAAAAEAAKAASGALKSGRTCKDILTKDPRSRNGIYNLVADGKSFRAYCDMTGGGWVVFQRRMDGSTNFHQNFATYVKGFGNKEKEYWLGLDTMHKLTKSRTWTLEVDLEDFKGIKASAKYSNFKIGAGDGYKLTFSKFLGGGAGDSLVNHNNMKFSTFDKDQDSYIYHCAVRHQGAWWFNNCYRSNLNAKLYGPKTAELWKGHPQGMVWKTFKGWKTPMKKTVMKIMEE